MKTKISVIAFIVGCSLHTGVEANNKEFKPVISRSIGATFKSATTSIGNITLRTTNHLFRVGASGIWGKSMNIGTGVNALSSKIAKIYIDQSLRNICSNDSLHLAEDICFTPPQFIDGYFCISVYDRDDNQYAFRTSEFLAKSINSSYDAFNSQRDMTVKSYEQVCYTDVGTNPHVKITRNGNPVFYRPLESSMFDGNYGGVIKNGRFHLVREVDQPEPNTTALGKLGCDLTRYWSSAESENACINDFYNEYAPYVRDREALLNFMKINAEAIDYDELPVSSPSFYEAIEVENLNVYKRDVGHYGISSLKSFTVARRDVLIYPDMFNEHEIGNVYWLLLNFDSNIVKGVSSDGYAVDSVEIDNGLNYYIIRHDINKNVNQEFDENIAVMHHMSNIH